MVQASNDPMIRRSVIIFLLMSLVSRAQASGAQVTLNPADNVPRVVSSHPPGTTFIFTPGTYRLSQSIRPKDNDRFIGQTSCAPPTTPCPAIISGAKEVGWLAVQDSTTGYYKVTGQNIQGPQATTRQCLPLNAPFYYGCIYPEDLFFDSPTINANPLRHVYAPVSTCPSGGSNPPPTLTTGQWWFDYPCHIVWFFDNPSGHTVELSVVNGAFAGTANNVTIQYLTVEEIANMFPMGGVGAQATAMNDFTQDVNWTIANSEVWGAHSFGVRVNYQAQILNNYLHHNGQAGIGGGLNAAGNGFLSSSDTGNTLTWLSGPEQFNQPTVATWTGGQIELGWNRVQSALGRILTVASCPTNTSCTTIQPPGNNASINYTFPIVGTQTTPSGVLVEGNTITYNNYAGFDPGFGAGGAKTGATGGITYRGNTIQHNLGAGIHFDDQSAGCLVDNNLITDNTDGSGVAQEISTGPCVVRNNIILRNGQNVYTSGSYSGLWTNSSGNEAYCNLVENGNLGHGVNAWAIIASNRGYSQFPPFQYLTSFGNYTHHNTVIWDSGSTAVAGFFQSDPGNQPNFFSHNTPPDFNAYHIPDTSATNFIYDNNNSKTNSRKTFANYQVAGADVHGTIDTKYNVGFPTVSITSPADQSSFNNSVAVNATASDTSGISKVEFYVDWALQATVTRPPYSVRLSPVVGGPHTVAAVAYSNAGIRGCYAVTLNEQ
jgi:parallel beta-helix repeat protein